MAKSAEAGVKKYCLSDAALASAHLASDSLQDIMYRMRPRSFPLLEALTPGWGHRTHSERFAALKDQSLF